MNSSNRASSLHNSPTQYLRQLGNTYGNKNGHLVVNNSQKQSLHHRNKRVSDWVNHVQFGKDYLHQYSEGSSNSYATPGHKSQVFPKQGGQLSPIHSILCNERISGTSPDNHQISTTATRHRSPKLKQSPRASPSKDGSIRSSPTIGGHYAGPKFSEPPAPTSLPKPPLHWTSLITGPLDIQERADKCHDISRQLKILLNVQA